MSIDPEQWNRFLTSFSCTVNVNINTFLHLIIWLLRVPIPYKHRKAVLWKILHVFTKVKYCFFMNCLCMYKVPVSTNFHSKTIMGKEIKQIVSIISKQPLYTIILDFPWAEAFSLVGFEKHWIYMYKYVSICRWCVNQTSQIGSDVSTSKFSLFILLILYLCIPYLSLVSCWLSILALIMCTFSWLLHFFIHP